MRKVKYYKCPECGKKFKTLSGWSGHMDMMHPDARPEGFSDSRFFYYILTGKTAGSCIECHSPTDWSEATGKYNRYCNNPACKRAYVKLAKSRMTNKYGKEYLLDDPDMQRKMVSSRKISGYYTFSDGSGKLGYVGSYEKDFLMMMDKFMRYSANDILSPSPNTYFYEYEGKKHFYIPDFYVPNLNLEIEIKASDNTHPKIQAVDKVKERLKDEVMQNNPKINYIKINDKVYTGFFDYLLSLKESVDDADVKGNVSNTAELSPSTEALDYIDDNKNDAEGEYDPSVYFYPEINLSPVTEASNNKDQSKKPIVFIFATSDMQTGFINYDKYEKFKVVNPLSPDTQYEITPDLSGNITKNGIGAYVTPKNFPDAADDKYEYLAFVYFVNDDAHQRFFSNIESRDTVDKPISYAWDSSVSRWLSHPNKYRFFCYSFVKFVLEGGMIALTNPVIIDEFNPDSIVLINCGVASTFSIDKMMLQIDVVWNSLDNISHEKPLIEEAVLEDEFYESMSPVLEELFYNNSFTEGTSMDDEATESLRSYVSHKNWEFNMDKWKPVAGSNVLYVTGYSGSGKTTYAKTLAKNTPNAVYVDTDLMVLYTEDKIKYGADDDSSRLARQFFKDHKGIIVGDTNDDGYVRVKYVMDWIEKYAHAHPSTLFVVDGVWMMYYCAPEYFRSKPIIVMGTSIAKSEYRRSFRDGDRNKDRRNAFRYASEDKIRKDFIDTLSSYVSENAKESYESVSPAEESIQLHTNFDKVKVKGTLSLSKFTKLRITQELLEKYKEKCASFGHCRVSNMSKGYLYVDKKDNIVGFVNVVKKSDGIKWIQALNIQPEYQGYGLYEQLLKVAVRELGGTDISAPPKNDTAKELYRKFGFRTYTDEESVHAMSIRADAQRVKYDAKAKPNATTMEEAGLYPVFVILTYQPKGFNKVVKFMTHAPYSHASISFDSSMNQIYTFATRDGHTMIPLGLADENIQGYKNSSPDAKFALYVKLVDKEDYDLMRAKVKEMYSHRTDFRYDIPGVVKTFFGKRNANEKRYFCSGFVAYILNSGRHMATDKSYDLVKPMDIPDIQNIHLVDMGLRRDYNKAYVDKKVNQIFKKYYMNKEKDSHKQPIDEDKKGEK